jgi:hypothetical protein
MDTLARVEADKDTHTALAATVGIALQHSALIRGQTPKSVMHNVASPLIKGGA